MFRLHVSVVSRSAWSAWSVTLGPTLPARTSYDSSRLRPGMLALIDHLGTIDEDMHHAGGVLMRLLKGGVILNPVRIEYHNVGIIALYEGTPFSDPEIAGWQRG